MGDVSIQKLLLHLKLSFQLFQLGFINNPYSIIIYVALCLAVGAVAYRSKKKKRLSLGPSSGSMSCTTRSSL